MEAASPAKYIGKSFAPTIFIHGTADTTVPTVVEHRLLQQAQCRGCAVRTHLDSGRRSRIRQRRARRRRGHGALDRSVPRSADRQSDTVCGIRRRRRRTRRRAWWRADKVKAEAAGRRWGASKRAQGEGTTRDTKGTRKAALFLCLLCLLCSFPLQRLTLLANPALSRPRITYQPISTCHQCRLKQAEAGLE